MSLFQVPFYPMSCQSVAMRCGRRLWPFVRRALLLRVLGIRVIGSCEKVKSFPYRVLRVISVINGRVY